EVRDALPHSFFIQRPRLLRRRSLLRLVVNERAIPCAAAAARAFGADDAEDGEVVLHSWNAGLRRVADHLTNIVDLTVPLRTFAHHDVRVLDEVNGVAAERQRHHVEFNAELLDALAQPR